MNQFHIVCFVLSFSLTVFCLPEEMQELVQMLHSTCVNETNVNEELILKVNSDKVMINDGKLKCYIKCLLWQTGSISDEGIVDVDATVALLPEEMKKDSEPVIRQCGSIVGADPCDSAWLTHKCYIETNADAYILI